MGITLADLKTCRDLKILANVIYESTKQTRNQSEATTARLSQMPVAHSGKTDKTGNGAAKLADLTRQLDEVADEFAEQAEAVCEEILKLESPMQRLILYLRYIDGLEWYHIEKRTSYSRAQANRIHNAALDALGIKSENEKDDTP